MSSSIESVDTEVKVAGFIVVFYFVTAGFIYGLAVSLEERALLIFTVMKAAFDITIGHKVSSLLFRSRVLTS